MDCPNCARLTADLAAAEAALAKVRDWMGDPLAAHKPLSEIHTNAEILAIVTAALATQKGGNP